MCLDCIGSHVLSTAIESMQSTCSLQAGHNVNTLNALAHFPASGLLSIFFAAQTIRKPSSISQEELLQLIDSLNCDPTVDGLLVQLPLPNHINESAICNAISPEKDVDGFNQINIG